MVFGDRLPLMEQAHGPDGVVGCGGGARAARSQVRASSSRAFGCKAWASPPEPVGADTDGYSPLTREKDNNGLTTTHNYDTTTRLSSDHSAKLTSDTASSGLGVSYTQSALVDRVTGPTGLHADYTYTSSDLTSAADLAGKTTAYSYDTSSGNHLLTTITTPRGSITRIGYEAGGTGRVTSLTRVTNTANNTGPTWTFTYGSFAYDSSAGRYLATTTVSVSDPNAPLTGHTTTYTYGTDNRVVKVIDALNHTRKTSYTPNGDVASSTDAVGSGNTTTYSYNSLTGSYTGRTLPTGASESIRYTDSVHPYMPSGATNAQGDKTDLTRDTAGNVTQSADTTTGGTGIATTATYQGAGGVSCGALAGQICSTNNGAAGHTTTYTYSSDGKGRLVTVTPPSPLGSTHMTYDGLSRVSTRTDGKGQTTTTVYDNLDRVLELRYNGATSCTPSAGTCVRYTYDADGNQTSMADSTGTTTYGYDKLNRQTSKTSPGVSIPFSRTYDAESNTLTYTDSQGTVTYAYNAANQLTSLAEPGGSCTGTTSKCTTFGNDNNGRRTSTTYPGGTVMTSTYDASGRVTRVKTVHGATTISDYQYAYTTGSSDRTVIQTRTDANGAVIAYGYDTAGRLTSARETTAGATSAAWVYCYDASGNLTHLSTATAAGAACTSSPSTAYGYNTADELTSKNGSTAGWSYDANGNETAANTAHARTAGTYNPLDQYTSVTVGGFATPFAYAGPDNRERTTAGTATFHNGPLGTAVETSGSGTTAYTRDPDGTLISLRTGGASYYYVLDNQHSVTALVNTSGTAVDTYSYDPYGAPRYANETIPNPHRYISGHLDTTTHLTKLGYRYYDPNLARFTQADPTGQEPNAYLYASGNPISFTDTTGALSLQCAAAGVVGTAAGALFGGALGAAGGPVGSAAGGAAGAAAVAGFVTEACGSDSTTAGGRALDGLGGAALGIAEGVVATVSNLFGG